MAKTQDSDASSCIVAVIFSAVVSVAATALGIYYFKNYGLVLFVFLPVLSGILSTFIYSPDNEKSFGKAVRVSFTSILAIARFDITFCF